jgi:PAS domain S-box-containing protein
MNNRIGTPAEAMLRDNQAWLAGVVDSAMDAIITVDGEQRIVLFNRAAETMFHCSAKDALGEALNRFIPERFRAVHSTHIQSFGQTGTATRAMADSRAVYGLRSNGEEFPLEASISQLESEGRKFYTVILRDITERKRAEESLKEQARILDLAPVLIRDANGRIIFWNTGAEQMYGWKSEEALGKVTHTLFQTEFPQPLEEIKEKIFSQGHWEGELIHTRRDGKRIVVASHWVLHREEREQPGAILEINNDITERKRAEERFRQLIERAPNGMVMVDSKGRIVLVNAQIEKSFGYTRHELLEQPIEMLVPERFHAHHSTYRNAFLADPTARPMGSGRDLFGRRRDGSEFPVEIGLNPLETEQGMMVLGTIVDITERKRAEEMLRQSQEQLTGVIGSAMDAIISVDEEQHIVLFNAAAERMFHCPAEEAIGRPLIRFIPERFRSAHNEHIQDFGRTHVTKRSMGALGAIFGLRADGEEFPIEASISQLESEGRKFYTVILRDITERKRAEEQNRRLNETLEQRVTDRTAQLQAANKELEAFSYSVSHDLRAPLRHINGFSQALLEDYEDKLDEVGKSYLQEVRGASQEMAQLIDDMLQLARVTRSEIRRERVNLSEIARTVITKLQEQNSERAVTIDIKTDVWAYGDKRLLRIVLDNLLGNAWKFTAKKEQAEIAFGQEQKDGESVYWVRDNGAGFDMAFADKLFGAFQRLHSTNEFEGTGIGLATVQRIVHRHGGKVRAEGALHAGATFYFSLPDFKEENT